MSESVRPTWDIFCDVVDNFGDVGVCWRLARQLAAEHGVPVRLWVNDLASFARIWPEIDSAVDAQCCRGVEVRRWGKFIIDVAPADVVVETFGCTLPDGYQAAMAAQPRAPAWINLEYLSAETWVEGCHGLPSPHPLLPLTKYYFFPGFTPATGGLLRERDILARRSAFLASDAARATHWQAMNLRPPLSGEMTISLFCYETPAIPELLDAWVAGPGPVRCLVPDTPVAAAVTGFFRRDERTTGGSFCRGNLTVEVFPLLSQDCYDELLWSCDCNFVRGEDSFVRAQWAGRPFVWHIYPQKENAHWIKLNAFVDLIAAGMPLEAADSLRGFWRAWVSGRGAGDAWPAFRAHWGQMCARAGEWSEQQAARPDLATNLRQFAHKLLK